MTSARTANQSPSQEWSEVQRGMGGVSLGDEFSFCELWGPCLSASCDTAFLARCIFGLLLIGLNFNSP